MRILIVDDSPMQQKIARIYLEKGYGYTLLTAQNGKEGVELARLETPDLILMDMEMPVMNGMEALIALKKDILTSQIPVIICTSSAEEPSDFIQAGAAGYLKKPHGYSALNSIINEIIQPVIV